MAEFIDRERVIQEIKDLDNCGCITRSVNHVCENIRCIPTADVIEHSKIDKAIEQIDFLRQHRAKYITEDNKICIDSGEVLKILHECIGE